MQQSTTPTPVSSFTFTVLGKPAPQGSKRHVGRGVMVESSKRCKPWRQDVRHTAMDLLPSDWYANMSKAITLSCVFVFARPKNHFRTNGHLKPSAPRHCSGRIGDISKLVRAVEDAMTGVVYNDDAQIINLIAHRRFANDREQPCAIITVTALS
jgi:Holliday junction resolvase RusA-like endonuclease